MKYEIYRTEHFSQKITDLMLYIAEASGFTDRALHTVDRIEEAVLRLADFPESGILPRYESIRRKGYRILVVERYLIFYRVDTQKEIVYLEEIFDGRQLYINYI